MTLDALQPNITSLMKQRLRWRFPENQEGIIEGPQHPGMANFQGDRATAIIREAVQNSLDARDTDNPEPVLVKFEQKYLSKDLLSADSLAQHIQNSLKSPHNTDEHRPTFEKALLLLGGG